VRPLLLSSAALTATAASVFGGWLHACSVGHVDYTGKTCVDTCPDGWSCVGGYCEKPALLDAAPDDVDVPDVGVSDVSDADAGSTADSGIDSGFDCAAHAFCDDFTTGEAIGPPKWDQFSKVGTTSTLDTSAWTSPPSSLLVDVAPYAGGPPYPHAALAKTFTASVSLPHIDFEWDVRVDEASADKSIDYTLLGVQVADPDFMDYAISVYILGNGWYLLANGSLHDGGTAPGAYVQVASLPVGVWRQVTLGVTAGATTSYVLAFDGQTVATGKLASLARATAYVANFGVASTYLPMGTAGWKFRFDNFTEDALAH
jgi:hypothetical protein